MEIRLKNKKLEGEIKELLAYETWDLLRILRSWGSKLLEQPDSKSIHIEPFQWIEVGTNFRIWLLLFEKINLLTIKIMSSNHSLKEFEING